MPLGYLYPRTEIKNPSNTQIRLFLGVLLVWSFVVGRLCAFGFRVRRVFWLHKIKYENWYMLTPILYRPKQWVYLCFHLQLLMFILFASNTWAHMMFVNGLFSYWHPLFLEDLVPWKKSSVVGFVILLVLSISIVAEHHLSEQVVIASIIINFVYLFVPCVHACAVLKTPTRVTLYEGRKTRNKSSIV